MRTQASNADKVLIESVIIKPTLEGKIVNKKTPGFDCFYNSAKVIINIQHDLSQNQCINLYNIKSSIYSESSPLIEHNLQTHVHESSITNCEIAETK